MGSTTRRQTQGSNPCRAVLENSLVRLELLKLVTSTIATRASSLWKVSSLKVIELARTMAKAARSRDGRVKKLQSQQTGAVEELQHGSPMRGIKLSRNKWLEK